MTNYGGTCAGLGLVLALGCGDDAVPGLGDAGAPGDGGGPGDAGALRDGDRSSDADRGDAGVMEMDAGAMEDAATADAGSPSDAEMDAAMDAGTDAGPPPIPSSCAPLDGYDDVSAWACAYERTHAAGETMPIDVFAPLDATGAPVVVFFHGGGFIEGSRHGARRMLARLAREAGIVGMTVEYELRPSSGAIPLPTDVIESRDEMEFMRDGASALLFGREAAAAFGGDPDRLVLMGHSAGGVIVTLLGVDPAWLRDALVASGRTTRAEADAIEPRDLVAGVANLSGPVHLDLSEVWYGGRIQDLLRTGFTPAMQREASAVVQLERSGSAPPLFLAAGGGASGLVADPAAIATEMRVLAVGAQALGVSAHFIQPVFHSVRTYTDIIRAPSSGQPCWSHMTHVDTELVLADPDVPLVLDQAYSEGRAGVCNLHVLDGVRVTHPEYRDAVTAFALDPGAPIAWATPQFSHRSIPDVEPSPFRFNLGGGRLPGADREAWSDGYEEIAVDRTVRLVSDLSVDRSGVRDSDGNEVPEGVFDSHLGPFGAGTTIRVAIPVPAGRYALRLYFGETWRDRTMEVYAEGALLASDVHSLGADPLGTARVVELPAVMIDDTLDLEVRRAGATGPAPVIAGVELVPML